MRTTVSIPLHRSEQWVESIAANIDRLRGVCHVVVSDASGLDDALDTLSQRFADEPGVTFLGPRALGAGWVNHCNDLLERCTSQYTMWLPHDDEITAEWIIQGEALLDQNHAASAAVGTLIDADRDSAEGVESSHPARVELPDAFASADRETRVGAALGAVTLGEASDLGLLFRGVVRLRDAPFLVSGSEEGAWVDLHWAVELLVTGAVLRMPTATYAKRWLPESARAQWPALRNDPTLRPRLSSELAELPEGSARRLIVDAWSAEAVELIARIDSLWTHVRGLEQHTAGLELHAAGLEEALIHERATVAGLTRELGEQKAAYESSRSWRLTSLFRAARRRNQ